MTLENITYDYDYDYDYEVIAHIGNIVLFARSIFALKNIV